ncbi:MAG: phosphoglycerate kinase [Luminiphilus sp.]|nr:phosphoglycerate kinase [Luminiphilus sp.]
MLTMESLSLTNQRVLIREDLNVPIKDGVVANNARLRAAVPTIHKALEQGAGVILMSHLGRPTEGVYDPAYSLLPVADALGALLGRPVTLMRDWPERSPLAGDVWLLENVRFNEGEKGDDDALARRYASLCDVFVMDAFGTAHRAQASTHGVIHQAATSCAGPLLQAELEALEAALAEPKKPLVAMVGGSKVSTKLAVLERLVELCDQLLVGGGIANTFLAAAGYPVGKSLYEADLVPMARTLMSKTQIPLPLDVVVAQSFSEDATATTKLVAEVGDDDMILDIGPLSQQRLADVISEAGTLLWNGPVGVFEFPAFAAGTAALARAVAKSDAFSVAGGGDTLAAIDQFGIADQVSYISTGGGAFLEYVEGKELPAVRALKAR